MSMMMTMAVAIISSSIIPPMPIPPIACPRTIRILVRVTIKAYPIEYPPRLCKWDLFTDDSPKLFLYLVALYSCKGSDE